MATEHEEVRYGGGRGGKFQKRPIRRSHMTPDDRPPTALRNSAGKGWLSKLVDPAQKLITSSAHRLFSSVFRKRLPPPPPSLPLSRDNMEKAIYIRFIVSNAAAGSVIGKGGSTINDFQSQSGARIQLSRNHEFFPGTTDRIIMVSGSINEFVKAMELVLAKLLSELHAEEGDDVEPRTKVRLIVPHSSCGAIIGKGGSTIRFLDNAIEARKPTNQDI